MEETVARCDHDRVAWEGLEEMREGLRGFLARHCPDPNDVEDVIQETLLRAARYRRRQSVQSLRSWTIKIALNVLADSRRRFQRAPVLPEEGADFDPPARVHERPASAFRIGRRWLEDDAARQLLLETIGVLGEDDRKLLGSFYGGSACSGEAAVECGIPHRLVKVRLYRARKRLLRALRRKLAVEERWQRAAS